MAEPWRIQLFGGLRVQCGERALTYPKTPKTGKPGTLLALVALGLGSRERLTRELWPEGDEDGYGDKGARLRSTLTKLRQDLEALSEAGSPESPLPADRSGDVRLNARVVTIDVIEFQEAVESARRAATPLEQARHWMRAVELYSGDLLPDYHEEWIVARRKELKEDHLRTALRLAEAVDVLAEAAAGSAVEPELLPRALDCLQRAARIHPSRDELPRALTRLYLIEGSQPRQGADASANAPVPPGRAERSLRPRILLLALAGLLILAASLSLVRRDEKPTSPGAVALYKEGRSWQDTRTRSGLRRSLEAFRQARQKAPNYAPAYAGLADSWSMIGHYNYGLPKEAFREALKSAEEAVRLDPNSAETYTSRGWARLFNGYGREAEQDIDHAIDLDKNYGPARQRRSYLLILRGKIKESLQEIETATESDPDSPVIHFSHSLRYYYAREYERAKECAAEALLREPHFLTHQRLALAQEQRALEYAREGLPGKAHAEFVEAMAHFDEAVKLSHREDPASRAGLGHVYALSGRRTEAERVLHEMEAERFRWLDSDGNVEYVPPDGLAMIHLGLYDADRGRPGYGKRALAHRKRALALLEEAVGERSVDPALLAVDPRLDGVRPECGRLLAALNRPAPARVSAVLTPGLVP